MAGPLLYRPGMTFVARNITWQHRRRAFTVALMLASAGLFSLATAHSLAGVAGGITITIVSLRFVRALHRSGGW